MRFHFNEDQLLLRDTVHDFLEAESTPLVRTLSLHSIGRRILYPYGGRWRGPEDTDAHRAAGTACWGRSKVPPLRRRKRPPSGWR